MSKLLELWAYNRLNVAGAFERAVDPHMHALYRLAWRWCGDPGDAEDLLQDLLCKLYPKYKEVLSVEQLRPWLIRVMYHIFVDSTRRRRQRPLAFSELIADADTHNGDENAQESIDSSSSASNEPEALADRELTQDRLYRALRLLPETQQALVIMHHVEGYSLPELAEILEIRAETLKVRLHRARERLRSILWDSDCNHLLDSCVLSHEE